jgi:hypothetical protein
VRGGNCLEAKRENRELIWIELNGSE